MDVQQITILKRKLYVINKNNKKEMSGNEYENMPLLVPVGHFVMGYHGYH